MIIVEQQNNYIQAAKAAREFNLAMIDLVKFFESIGHILNLESTTYLTLEQYKILKTQFNPNTYQTKRVKIEDLKVIDKIELPKEIKAKKRFTSVQELF